MPGHGVIILAAGTSSRMGAAKQLLDCAGEPLLLRMVRIALASQAQRVVVVLGACMQDCAAVLADEPVRLIENVAWQEGMASSIRAGVAALQHEVDGCVILLGDQPMVSTALLDQMFAAGHRIVAASYDGIVGPPVFFSRPYFDELLALQGEHGARRLLRAHAAETTTIDFAAASCDLDTPQDYENWLTSTTAPRRDKQEP
jgi:CTP:molybdopterin cytidylyltransferase MocA